MCVCVCVCVCVWIKINSSNVHWMKKKDSNNSLKPTTQLETNDSQQRWNSKFVCVCVCVSECVCKSAGLVYPFSSISTCFMLVNAKILIKIQPTEYP